MRSYKQIRRVTGGPLKGLCTVVTLLAVGASASPQAPTWKVQLETMSGSVDPTGIVVDSTGYTVTLVPARGLDMPRCAQLDDAQRAQLSRNVSWLMKHLKVGDAEWYGHCKDDPQVKVFIQGDERALPLRYPLDANCRDVEPPAPLRQLVQQLLEVRAQALNRCQPAPH